MGVYVIREGLAEADELLPSWGLGTGQVWCMATLMFVFTGVGWFHGIMGRRFPEVAEIQKMSPSTTGRCK